MFITFDPQNGLTNKTLYSYSADEEIATQITLQGKIGTGTGKTD